VPWEQLNEEQRAAAQSKMNTANAKEMKQKMAAEAEAMKLKTRESVGMPMKKWMQSATESLGKQVIEGVECEGMRTTTTIPAGKVGNDLPLDIVSEEWYSPALQVLVLTRHNDPRSGETTYRLTNINRSEPDRALFEVPADYKIEKVPPVKKRKPEEEQQ
jgi:hypothetical protein